jgi:RNA processing factor Prp31
MQKSSNISSLAMEQVNISKQNISNVILDLLQEYHITTLSEDVQNQLLKIQNLENEINATIQKDLKKENAIKKRVKIVDKLTKDLNVLTDEARSLIDNININYNTLLKNNEKFVELVSWLDKVDDIFDRLEDLKSLSKIPYKFDLLSKSFKKTKENQNCINIFFGFMLTINTIVSIFLLLILKGVI